MQYLIIFVVVFAATVSGEVCDLAKCQNQPEMQYYNELNCKPVHENGACCPSRFDCTAALSGRVRDKCYSQVGSFSVGARLTNEEIAHPCLRACRCQGNSKGAYMSCASVECFGTHLYKNGSCSKPDECCPSPGPCNTTAATSSFTCQYSGKSYKLGEKFDLENEETCMDCICQEGFDGTLREPWCKYISCAIQLKNSDAILGGCAPVYYGSSRCCPISWRWPNDSDKVIRSSSKTVNSTASGECTFGKLRLKVGDQLNKSKKCIVCSCSLPPHVSCVQQGHC